MTIRDKIFDKLEELNMTQKAFSEKTGIAESTISDWKKKKTNPTADKIMVICKVLNVAPEWLLSDIEPQGERGNPRGWYAIKADTDGGKLITAFNSMDKAQQARLLGYAEAIRNFYEKTKE